MSTAPSILVTSTTRASCAKIATTRSLWPDTERPTFEAEVAKCGCACAGNTTVAILEGFAGPPAGLAWLADRCSGRTSRKSFLMASKVHVKAKYKGTFKTTALGIGRDTREPTHAVETRRGATVTRK